MVCNIIANIVDIITLSTDPHSINTLKIDIKFESQANIIISGDSTLISEIEKDTTPGK